MKKVFTIILLLGALYSDCSAQAPCPNSYTFEQFGVDSTVFIHYDTTFTLDSHSTNYDGTIYEPSGDTSTNRPIIFIIHRGYFNNLIDRSSESKMSRSFAKRGFVVVTLDHVTFNDRFQVNDWWPCNLLWGEFPSVWRMNRSIYVNLINEFDYPGYGIDTSNIWVLGHDNGSLIASWIATPDTINHPMPGLQHDSIWPPIPVNVNIGGIIMDQGYGGDTNIVEFVTPMVGFVNLWAFRGTTISCTFGDAHGPRWINEELIRNNVCSRVYIRNFTFGNDFFEDSVIVSRTACFIWETICGTCVSGGFTDSVGTMYVCPMNPIARYDDLPEKEFRPGGKVSIFDLTGRHLWEGTLKDYQGRRGTYLIRQDRYWFKYYIE